MATSKLKRSLWALAISVSFNVVFVVFWLYEWQEGGVFAPVNSFFEEMAVSEAIYQNPTLEEEAEFQSHLPFARLIALLDDKGIVSDGYKKRDIAIAVLTSFHHFHLEKALRGHLPRQAREIEVSSKKITLYPGLLDEHYSCLGNFAKTEKWPLTPQGLFVKLQSEPADVSLRQAFIRTEEYHLLHSIFAKGTSLGEEQLLAIILASDWSLISQIARQKPLSEEGYREIRRAFLYNLMKKNRSIASEALVICDFPYALKLFDDPEAIFVLEEMQTRPDIVRQFALGLLKSPRSDEVWEKACKVLCSLSNLDPQQYTREKILDYFGPTPVQKAPTAAVVQKTEQPVSTTAKGIVPKKPVSEVMYIVQSGDSLWSISKKFHVDIATIKKHNQLQSDALKPGTSLRIPMGT